jgi:hypothetical protein
VVKIEKGISVWPLLATVHQIKCLCPFPYIFPNRDTPWYPFIRSISFPSTSHDMLSGHFAQRGRHGCLALHIWIPLVSGNDLVGPLRHLEAVSKRLASKVRLTEAL